MKTSNYSRMLFATIVVVLFSTLLAAGQEHKAACDRQLYKAPDGRLEPHIVGLVPRTNQPVVGFEVVHDRPLVAFPHLLVAFDKKGIAELPVGHAVKGLSYARNSGILLQADNGFLRLSDQGLEPAARLNTVVHGRIYGSGGAVFVEVRARRDTLQFVARTRDGRAFPIAAIRGRLRAASWNESGLAAIVGDSLYLWQPGAKNIVRVLTDRGLASARDVVAVGNNRAVVALKNTVALVGNDTLTILAALPSARCRFQDGVLYVLQESNGAIWSFGGLEKLGTKQADRAYALDLLKQSENLPAKDGFQFGEAARILGCKEASAEVGR